MYPESNQKDWIAKARDSEKIHTKKQLIIAADELQIDRSWYSFNRNIFKPVSLSGKSVYYGNMGVTTCHSGYGMYDVMLEELLKYKKRYIYLKSEDKYRLIQISANFSGSIKNFDKVHGKVLVTTSTQTDSPAPEKLQEGWVFSGYDHYSAVCCYEKTGGNEILEDVTLLFEKKTDKHDRDIFGFTEVSMLTSVSYSIPDNLRTDIFYEGAANPHSYFTSHGIIGGQLALRVIDAVGGMDAVIKKEYANLLEYCHLVRKRLFSAAEHYIRENKRYGFDQNAFNKYVSTPTKEERILDCNHIDSRSHSLFHLAYSEIKKLIRNGNIDKQKDAYLHKYQQYTNNT